MNESSTLDKIGGVLAGDRAIQVSMDTMDVLQLALAVFIGMLAALIVFQGLKVLAS